MPINVFFLTSQLLLKLVVLLKKHIKLVLNARA